MLSWFGCFHKYNLFPPKGKVHGSLARAGKVRGQTPKVKYMSTIFISHYLGHVLVYWLDSLMIIPGGQAGEKKEKDRQGKEKNSV